MTHILLCEYQTRSIGRSNHVVRGTGRGILRYTADEKSEFRSSATQSLFSSDMRRLYSDRDHLYDNSLAAKITKIPRIWYHVGCVVSKIFISEFLWNFYLNITIREMCCCLIEQRRIRYVRTRIFVITLRRTTVMTIIILLHGKLQLTTEHCRKTTH